MDYKICVGKGYRFTWCNQQSGASRLEERLDKFCANGSRLNDFSSWKVEHLDTMGSDHLVLKLKFCFGGSDKLSIHN